MAERCNAHLLEVVAAQSAQQAGIDFIRAERCRVLTQPNSVEPGFDVQDHSSGLSLPDGRSIVRTTRGARAARTRRFRMRPITRAIVDSRDDIQLSSAVRLELEIDPDGALEQTGRDISTLVDGARKLARSRPTVKSPLSVRFGVRGRSTAPGRARTADCACAMSARATERTLTSM